MGVILELARARQKIKELEIEVAELEGQIIPPPAPTIKGIISFQELYSLIAGIFPTQMDKVFFSDLNYEITAISEIRRFVEWDDVNIFPYLAEVHDCDDFAAALAGDFSKYPGWSGFPATDVWGSYLGGHAFFLVVAWPSFEDRTPTVYYVEPQNDHELAAEMIESMDLWVLVI